MTISRQKKASWERRLEQLAKAAQKAQENLLVGIYEARQDGLSQSIAAHSIGDKSDSGIRAKEEKGKAIVEGRKRGPKPS